MLTVVLIGVPIFFIMAATIGVLSLSTSPEVELAEQPEARASAPQPHARPVEGFMVFTPPRPGTRDTVVQPSPVLVEALLRRIEEDLHDSRIAARSFVENPSSSALWLN